MFWWWEWWWWKTLKNVRKMCLCLVELPPIHSSLLRSLEEQPQVISIKAETFLIQHCSAQKMKLSIGMENFWLIFFLQKLEKTLKFNQYSLYILLISFFLETRLAVEHFWIRQRTKLKGQKIISFTTFIECQLGWRKFSTSLWKIFEIFFF